MNLDELQNLGTDVLVVDDGADFFNIPFLVHGSLRRNVVVVGSS